MKKIVMSILVGMGLCFAAHAVEGTWNTTGNNNWTNPASTVWIDSLMPVNAGDIAHITKNLGANRIITISSPVSGGWVDIGDPDSTHTYTVSGTGSYTFNNNGSAAKLRQNSGSAANTWSVGTVLNDNLSLENLSTAYRFIVSSAISGNRSITVDGGAGVNMDSASTYSGGTTLNSGKLALGSGALGSGTFTINGGSLDSGGGAGAQTLTNSVVINSDFTSDITSTKTLVLNGPITLGTASGISRTINATTNGTGVLGLNGVITAGTTADRLVKTGTGTLLLSGQSTFSGGVVLAEGAIRINNSSTDGAGALGTGTLTISNATTFSSGGPTARTISNKVVVAGNFSMGDTASKAPLTLAGAMDLAGGNRTITIIQTNLGNTIISGVISNGALSVAGALDSGLTLSGENTYADGTTVLSGGKLLGDSNSAFGTGGLTVENGATLILGSGGTAKDYIDNLANLILGGTSVLALNFTGADTVGGISLDGGTSWLVAGTYSAADLDAGGTGTYTGIGSLTVIPEPATIGMLGVGVALVMMLRRRMR